MENACLVGDVTNVTNIQCLRDISIIVWLLMANRIVD